MSDPASIKKALSAQFSVDVPPPLDPMEPEALATALKTNPSSITVVDVRQPEEYRQGSIRGSRNMPLDSLDFEALSRELATRRKAEPTHRLVFASLQSPDIDDAAAQDFVQAYYDVAVASDNRNDSNAAAFVTLLLGGVCHWLQLYGNDSTLSVVPTS